jgi:hypothetical protein
VIAWGDQMLSLNPPPHIKLRQGWKKVAYYFHVNKDLVHVLTRGFKKKTYILKK